MPSPSRETPKATRIAVIGLPGAGKSCFSKQLARRIGVRHIETDRHFWGAKDFRSEIAKCLETDGWVVEGHFTKIRDLVLPRVERIIYLDYPVRVVLYRFLIRKLKEPFQPGRSLLRWLRHFRRARAAFESVSDSRLLRLRSPVEAKKFLESY